MDYRGGINLIVKCDVITCEHNGGVSIGALGECTLEELQIKDCIIECPGCFAIADDQPCCTKFVLDPNRIKPIF